VLAPPLVRQLAAEAPLAQLYISAYTPDVFDRMDAHRVDFLVSSAISPPARIEREVIMNEELMWVVRAGHPLSSRRNIDLGALASVPHVVISAPVPAWADEAERRSGPSSPGWDPYGAFETALASQGVARRVGVSVPDTYSAMAVVLNSDMAVLVPRRLAAASAMSGRFALIEPPYESPKVELALLYLRDRLVEPAIAWMREQIRATALSL
jgi:DNA-binding transcriptional LysR family regulator